MEISNSDTRRQFLTKTSAVPGARTASAIRKSARGGVRSSTCAGKPTARNIEKQITRAKRLGDDITVSLLYGIHWLHLTRSFATG